MASFKIGVAAVTKTISIHRPGFEPEEFTAEIRVRSIDEQEEIEKKRREGEIKDLKHIRGDILSVSDIVDAKDKPVESSETLIDSVFNDPYAHLALCRAWGEVQRGVQEETAKN